MRVYGEFVKLLKPGLIARFRYADYKPTNKRIKKLIKKHPKASCDLWVDAFNLGIEWGKMVKNENMER